MWNVLEDEEDEEIETMILTDGYYDFSEIKTLLDEGNNSITIKLKAEWTQKGVSDSKEETILITA